MIFITSLILLHINWIGYFSHRSYDKLSKYGLTDTNSSSQIASFIEKIKVLNIHFKPLDDDTQVSWSNKLRRETTVVEKCLILKTWMSGGCGKPFVQKDQSGSKQCQIFSKTGVNVESRDIQNCRMLISPERWRTTLFYQSALIPQLKLK